MPQWHESDELKKHQYGSVDKLAARIRLHERFNRAEKPMHPFLFDIMLAEIPEEANILEVGSGGGDLWAENADRIPGGWQLTLTDFSPGMLEDCKKRVGAERAAKITWDVVDVTEIKFPAASYDAVAANFMLYHAPDISRAIAEIARVLKPGGVLIAATNGVNHMTELMALSGRFQHEQVIDYASFYRNTFSLQNGTAQLSAAFDAVRLIAYPSALHVTEVQPILDYVASMADVPADVFESALGQQVAAELQTQLERDGEIVFPKDTGVFVARLSG